MHTIHRRSRRATMSAVALLLAMAGTLTAACEEPPPIPPRAELPTASVEVVPLVETNEVDYLYAVGRVKNVQESMVAAKMMGKAIQVRVVAGDRVQKGDVLVELDDTDAKARVSQARGALEQARAAVDISKRMRQRFEALVEGDSAARAKHDEAVFEHRRARGAVRQARGALKTAQSYLDEAVVRAPFAGIVVDTMIEQGEMASPGRPLVRLEGEGDVEFEAVVNGQDVASLEVTDEATVILDGPLGRPLQVPGVVHEIVPSSDSVTHSNIVRVRLSNKENVRSGAFGRIRFARSRAGCPGILVPEDRIVRQGQLTALYVVDHEDRVRLRLVKLGRAVSGKVELLTGARDGDRMVSSELEQLIDGQPANVTVVEPAPGPASEAVAPATAPTTAPAEVAK